MLDIQHADKLRVLHLAPNQQFFEKAGRNNVTIQAVTITIDRIMPLLAPGILALSRRARYFSIYPYLLDEYQRQRRTATMSALSAFIKQREYEYALAVQLCPNGCGQIASGVVGKQRASPAVNYSSADLDRGESVESYLGGYGLYYRTPLIELGIVARVGTPWGADAEPVPIDVLAGDIGMSLAEAFRTAISSTEYFNSYMTGTDPIPREVLKEYAARACLCRLVDAPEEQSLIRAALFEPRTGSPERDVEQRKRSFALFLDLVEECPEITSLDAAFRDTVREASDVGKVRSNAHANTLAQWSALIAKEYLQEGLSTIWAHVYRAGLSSQPVEGFSRDELDAFLSHGLLDADEVQIGDASIPVSPDMLLNDFHSAVVDAARHMTLEELRAKVVEQNTAIAGLALILALYNRIPDPTSQPNGWRQIGTLGSDHQPGLLGFGVHLQEHANANPTIAETLRWLGMRYVIVAHESIAYSKLPNFTFRFRWEQGRLRFYDLFDVNWARFGLTDIRRDAITRITEDIGMWEHDADGARLTKIGHEFVGSVFG